jgi:thioredoxin 1
VDEGGALDGGAEMAGAITGSSAGIGERTLAPFKRRLGSWEAFSPMSTERPLLPLNRLYRVPTYAGMEACRNGYTFIFSDRPRASWAPQCSRCWARGRQMLSRLPLETPVSELITHVSDDAFEQDVLKSDTPVLLDFWAEWCGPCKAIAPILEDLAKQYEGKLRIAKINIDHNQKTPRNYNVRGIPTLMVFKNGKVEATQIGAVSKGILVQMIDKAI